MYEVKVFAGGVLLHHYAQLTKREARAIYYRYYGDQCNHTYGVRLYQSGREYRHKEALRHLGPHMVSPTLGPKSKAGGG